MAQDFNVELRGTGVHALSIWPGAVRTELIKEHILDAEDIPNQPKTNIVKAKAMFSRGQTTHWVGKTVAQLLLDENIKSKAGRVIWCYDIADEFEILETDGTVVPNIRS